MLDFIKKSLLSLQIIVISTTLILNGSNVQPEDDYVYATASTNGVDGNRETTISPVLKDRSGLKVEKVLGGLNFPTSMAFLGPDDILFLEKNEGRVNRIMNGEMLEEPLLDVNVADDGEQGMLGIAIAEKKTDKLDDSMTEHTNVHVFLYYTEADGSDGGEAVGNRLYRYELDDNNEELVNPELILDLPASPGPTHNGGKIIIGPNDNNIYLAVGDVGEHDALDPSKAINVRSGPKAEGRAGILRIAQDSRVGEEEGGNEASGILGDEYPLNLYYAYGIRNSFGIDFDPITGDLWDVETGRYFGEEINLVKPGFNSGWMKAQGIWQLDENLRPHEIASTGNNSFASQLVDFDGRGEYSSPEFTWGKMPITTSGMAFFHSDKLGQQYENDLFVGDFFNGILFDFNLNENRSQLSFDDKGPLKDRIAASAEELEEVIFGYGFGGITDIKIGPDGYLYILSLDRGGDECKPQYPVRACIPYSSRVEGHIFRVVPAA